MRRLFFRGGHLVSAAPIVLCALFLASCGGGDAGPTGPVPQPPVPPAAPGVLVANTDSARASEFITLRPIGLGRTVPDTVTGKAGTADLRAIKLNDSTLVALVPKGIVGTQTVRIDIAGRSFTTPLVFREPLAVVADPTGAATTLFNRVLARYDSVDASIAAGQTNGVDSAAVRRFVTAGRASVAQARNQFMALSVDERREAIPYILAEAAAVGLELTPPASPSVVMLSHSVSPGQPQGAFGSFEAPAQAPYTALCTLTSAFQMCGKVSDVGKAIYLSAREVAKCSAKTLGTSAVGGVVGGVVGGGIGFFFGAIGSVPGGIAGVKNGAAIGAGVGIAWCASDVWEKLAGIYDAAIAPSVASVEEVDLNRLPGGDPLAGASPTPSMSGANASGTFKSGVPRRIDVYVDFKSLSAADAGGPSVLAGLVTEFNAMAQSWEVIRAKFSFMNLPAITLPAAPRVTVRKKVPGSYLSARAILPAPISASSAGTDSTWMVTFSNPPQGDDLDFTYTVRFTFPGFADQDRVRTGKLRPARYTVAALSLTPIMDTVMVGQGATIAWAARDSSGDVLPDSLLLGRVPAWTSASTTIATVGGASGRVSGVAAGSAAINAALETGKATASVLVVPDISGTYALTTENGVTIPGLVYRDSVYEIRTSSGAVTLRADGTFGYSRSAVGTNVRTRVTYDEGGSGSGKYVVNATGTALTFEVTAFVGVPTTFGSGTVSGKVLSVSVTTPTGSGSATLTRP